MVPVPLPDAAAPQLPAPQLELPVDEVVVVVEPLAPLHEALPVPPLVEELLVSVVELELEPLLLPPPHAVRPRSAVAATASVVFVLLFILRPFLLDSRCDARRRAPSGSGHLRTRPGPVTSLDSATARIRYVADCSTTPMCPDRAAGGASARALGPEGSAASAVARGGDDRRRRKRERSACRRAELRIPIGGARAGTSLAEALAMTLRKTTLVLASLAGLTLAGCQGPGATSDGPWADPVALDGPRNETLAAVAADTHVPAAVLYALAYQQSRFEDPEVTTDAPMDEAFALDDADLAAATDPWSDAMPDEDGEPLQLVDDTSPVEGLEAVSAEIAADPSAADFVLGSEVSAVDPELAQTVTPTADEIEAEEAADPHGTQDSAGVFFLTSEQVHWAASTLGVDEELVQSDLETNARAAAALLLADLRVSGLSPTTATHHQWEDAMVRFVGLDPSDDVGRLARDELHAILALGFDHHTLDGEEMLMVNLGGAHLDLGPTGTMDTIDTSAPETSAGGGVAVEALTSGYPALHWVAASSSNYSRGRGMSVRYVVVHDMEGTLSGAISVFRTPGRQASAHYLVRASDGYIVQMVNESDTAWHSGNWLVNHSSIGIEHEGFADRPRGGGYYTSTLYQSSARLTCAIANRYHIPIDRRHIVGHGNVPSSSSSTNWCSDAQGNAGVCGGASHHHDPGRYWDWTLYMGLVARCASGRPVTTPPTSTTPHPTARRTQHAITTGWGGQRAVVDADGALHVFGVDAAHRLVELVRSGSTFAPMHVIAGGVHGYPAAAVSGDRIVVAVRGADDRVHVLRSSVGRWDAAIVLDGLTVSTMPSLFVNQDGRVEIFVRGSDLALWHAAERSPGGDFGQWWSLGGHLSTMPTVVADAQHRPHVFAIGDASGHVWTRVRTAPTEWPAWSYLSAVGNTPVSPLALSDGRLAVFTRDPTGRLVAQVSETSGRWSASPRTIGGTFTGNVVATLDAHDRVNVFGRGTDGAVYRVVRSTNGHWGSFARLGGRVTMGPAVVRTSRGLEVFVAGRNHGLYHAWQAPTRTGWAGWSGRGGRFGWL